MREEIFAAFSINVFPFFFVIELEGKLLGIECICMYNLDVSYSFIFFLTIASIFILFQ